MKHLTDLAIPGTDRLRDLTGILKALAAQGRLALDSAEQLSALRRSATGETAKLHPLEFIASQAPDDIARPGKPLDLDSLTRWLASESGQPFYRIDPLKINVSAVTLLMSFAFAQRHGIPAVELNELTGMYLQRVEPTAPPATTATANNQKLPSQWARMRPSASLRKSHELPPQLPRRQSRRCSQTRHSAAYGHLDAAQGSAAVLSGQPRWYGAVRSAG